MKKGILNNSIFFLLFVFMSTTISMYSQEAKIRIIKEEAVLRLKPNSESLIIKELPLGSEFNVIETIRDWIKVKLPPDEDRIVVTGYIHSSFVTFDIKQVKPIQSEETSKQIQPEQITRLSQASFKPKASFSIGGGISSPVGEGSQYWNSGISINANGFGYLSRNILLGGYISFNRWTPDENELVSELPNVGIDWDISGSAVILEIGPSIRIIGPWTETQSVNVFAQAGFGYYLIELDATVKGSYLGVTYQESIEESQNKPGFNFGGGIILGKMGGFRLEIFPLYRIIFTDDGNTNYFTVSVLFGK